MTIASTSTLTHREKILIAAASLDGKRHTREDIAARAWECFPETFRMKRYPLPDSNAVYSKLFGVEGLIAKGLIAYEGGAYSVSRKGRRQVRALLRTTATAPTTAPMAPTTTTVDADDPPGVPMERVQRGVVVAPSTSPTHVTAAELDALRALVHSGVAPRVAQPRALTQADAAAFWGLRAHHLDAWAVAGLDTMPSSQREAIEALRTEATGRVVATGDLLATLAERTRDALVEELPSEARELGRLLHTHRLLCGRFGASFGAGATYAGVRA